MPDIDDREHVMTYTAGGALGGVHLRGPGWSCKCGGWAFRAKAMPRRKTGNNKIEALKSYRAHVDAAPSAPVAETGEKPEAGR